jgi:hypothetical protein
MTITIKPMKLKFLRNADTWDKVVTDMKDNIIFEQRGIKLFEENITEEYFNNWENQLRQIPYWNIVEVERFV